MSRFSVKVIPKSGRSSMKYEGETLKVWLKSAPEDGKANDELLLVLAKKFGISRSKIKITRGISSRNKIVDIEGINEEELKKAS